MFKYVLSDTQYRRFQHSTNDVEIRALCESAGVEVTDEQIVDGIETWYFRGRCAGTMALVPCEQNRQRVDLHDVRWYFEKRPHHWECWIQISKKPWWLPWFVLDYGFREALK